MQRALLVAVPQRSDHTTLQGNTALCITAALQTSWVLGQAIATASTASCDYAPIATPLLPEGCYEVERLGGKSDSHCCLYVSLHSVRMLACQSRGERPWKFNPRIVSPTIAMVHPLIFSTAKFSILYNMQYIYVRICKEGVFLTCYQQNHTPPDLDSCMLLRLLMQLVSTTTK